MSQESFQPTLSLHLMANAIRFLTVDAVQQAKSGHPGMPLGMADVATVLFTHFLKFDPMDPKWPDRDRFVLSAGHGSMLLYSLLYLTGYADMTLDEIKRFRQINSKTPGHPEYGETEGVETSTGPLGQGLGNAVGMALAEAILQARFGPDLVNHYTYVMVGDGDLMEGISQEAISFAGHMKLNKLIVLFDNNSITIDGPTSLSTLEDHQKRFEAVGWNTIAIDGHNYDQIFKALIQAQTSDKPTFISCKTVIGYGAPTKAGTAKVHGSPLGDDEIALMRKELDWPYPAFEVPEDILKNWREFGAKGKPKHHEWLERLRSAPEGIRERFLNAQNKTIDPDFVFALRSFRKQVALDPKSMATRKSSEATLDAMAPMIPQLLGGSADLTESNNTLAKSMVAATPENLQGNYIHYGIREHAMGAIMNGISLHGGFVPYGGTFLTFSDYMRPAIRLASLMHQQVVYVLTHDSVALGEDGPTHQPIEHLMSLRLIPNLLVFRPADTIETAECWELALQHTKGPSVLALTRQPLPQVREYGDANLCAKGGYVLSPADGPWDVSLIATGSEVSLALEVKKLLANRGLDVAVISMPCLEIFNDLSVAEQQEILGPKSAKRIAIEAGVTWGWEKYVGDQGLIIGIDRFGVSAPYKDVMEFFGFTAEQVALRIMKYMGE